MRLLAALGLCALLAACTATPIQIPGTPDSNLSTWGPDAADRGRDGAGPRPPPINGDGARKGDAAAADRKIGDGKIGDGGGDGKAGDGKPGDAKPGETSGGGDATQKGG
jgi:hypothetical protein